MTRIDFDKVKFLQLLFVVKISRLRRQRSGMFLNGLRLHERVLCGKHKAAPGGGAKGGRGGKKAEGTHFHANCCAEDDVRLFSQITDLSECGEAKTDWLCFFLAY